MTRGLFSHRAFTAYLTISNLGNIALNESVTVNAFVSASGHPDGTETKIAAVPLVWRILPGQLRTVKVRFVPGEVPPGADASGLFFSVDVPGDTNPANNRISLLEHATHRA